MLSRPVKTDRKGLKADLACQVKKRPVNLVEIVRKAGKSLQMGTFGQQSCFSL